MTDNPQDQPPSISEAMSSDQLRAVAKQLREQAAMLEHMAQVMENAASPPAVFHPDLVAYLPLALPLAESAETVIALAEAEARRFNHNYIGTEHLLLGIARGTDALTARILTQLEVDLPKVRHAVEFIIGRGDRVIIGEVGLTPRAKKVLELAGDEARRMRHQAVAAVHVLLGLVREGEGIAAGVLESLSVNLEKLRAVTLIAIQERQAEAETL